MKTFRTWLLTYVIVATGSTAQTVNTTPVVPSAVSEIELSTQPLRGTLFFGQQQRDRMNRARKGGGVSGQISRFEPMTSELNGFIKRSDGQSAIWINGQPRFNVQSDSVNRLQPSDVGGSADHIQVRTYSEATAAPRIHARQKNTIPLRRAMRKGSGASR